VTSVWKGSRMLARFTRDGGSLRAQFFDDGFERYATAPGIRAAPVGGGPARYWTPADGEGFLSVLRRALGRSTTLEVREFDTPNG